VITRRRPREVKQPPLFRAVLVTKFCTFTKQFVAALDARHRQSTFSMSVAPAANCRGAGHQSVNRCGKREIPAPQAAALAQWHSAEELT
jgi:hypothetical protein